MIGKYLILEKTEDHFNRMYGWFPVGIGSTDLQGYLHDEIKVGEHIHLHTNQNSKLGLYPTSSTSKVKSFDPESMTVVTKNSTYKITIREEEL